MCRKAEHRTNEVGARVAVSVVVLDRPLDVDVEKFGYLNMVGHAAGRDSVAQERHSRERIEQMRKDDMQRKRDRKITASVRDQPRRVGAIPSALLFALKRQYGNDYTQKAKELMKRENLWWGD